MPTSWDGWAYGTLFLRECCKKVHQVCRRRPHQCNSYMYCNFSVWAVLAMMTPYLIIVYGVMAAVIVALGEFSLRR